MLVVSCSAPKIATHVSKTENTRLANDFFTLKNKEGKTDEAKAGHVLEFDTLNLEFEFDKNSNLEFDLPETEAFKTKVFDLSQGYNKPAGPA